MTTEKMTTGKAKDDGFTAEERAAMKERAAELRADKRRRTMEEKAAEDAAAVVEKIAGMADEDRAIAEPLHALITEIAPELAPKLWYGMPNYNNQAGKSIVFFQDAAKFKARYATLGFNPDAALDEGAMWATSFALAEWNDEVAATVRKLVQKAVG